MESVPTLLLKKISRSRRARSVRCKRDEWLSPPSTARTSTARTSEPCTVRSTSNLTYDTSKEEPKEEEYEEYEEYEESEEDEEDEEEWVSKLNQSSTVRECMKQLYLCDPETFYLHGQHILQMVQFRFEHNLDEV